MKKEDCEDMFTEDTVECTVNISIAECTTVKQEIIDTEDPLLLPVQPGYYYYFICSVMSRYLKRNNLILFL